MRLSGTGDILSVDEETIRRHRRDATVAAILGRGGHRGPGSEVSSSSSSGGSAASGSSRSRSARGVEAAGSEATLVDEDDFGLGLGPNPTIGEVELASEVVADAAPSAGRASEFVNSQWLEERLESELKRQGALVPPTLIAPAVGPAGEEVWPRGVEPQDQGDQAVGSQAADSDAGEEDHGDNLEDDVMSLATSDAGSRAAGPQVPNKVMPQPGGPSFWNAVDQKITAQMNGVEQRLSTVLTTSLSEIATSQRDMMKHLTNLTKQVHDEAAYQRDVQREFSTRLDVLTESASGWAQATHGGPPTRRKERRASPPEAPRDTGGADLDRPSLPVPSTPARAFCPGDSEAATPQKVQLRKKKESRGKGGGSAPMEAAERGEQGCRGAADEPREAETTDPLTAADPWRRIAPAVRPPPPRGAVSSWAAFLANSSRRPEGLPGPASRSQASAASARGSEAEVRRVAQPTLVPGVQAPDPDLFIARQAAIGPFPFRTRSSIAKEEVLQILQRVQLSHLLDSFPGNAQTCESVIVRLVSFEAVQMLVQAMRSRPVTCDHSDGPL